MVKKTTTAKKAKSEAKKASRGSRLSRELGALAKMTKSALRKRYEEVFGHPTRSHNSTHLRNVIAQRLEELASANTKSSPAKSETDATVASVVARELDPRLPPVGTVLEREHHGKVHKVKVLDDGFEYEGKKYRSLSGLAKEITGAIWNGFAWFGLVAKKGASDAA